MKLAEALTRIGGTATEKTASAPSGSSSDPAAPSSASERLRQALKEATASSADDPSPPKTAAQGSPIEDLTKIAADLSGAEHDALVKEAQIYGAAVCDGFMARAAQYEAAGRKVAAAQGPSAAKVASDDSFEKFAAENPDLVKEAMLIGYNTTTSQLEKLAEDAFAKGWNDTMAQVYKTASDAFVAGFKGGQELLEGVR